MSKHSELRSRIFLRADANSDIGFGHVMRCLALASMVKNNFDCTFLKRHLPPGLENLVRKDCVNIVTIPQDIPHDQEASYLSKHVTKKDIVVLDGYGFDTDYQEKVKLSGCKLVSIDDIHASHFLADVIVNHAGGINKSLYSVEMYSEVYLGPRYALIREDFLPQGEKNHKKGRILVCMGGADNQNYTQQVLEELKQKRISKPITVVVGEAYNFTNQLREYVSSNFDAKVYSGLTPAAFAEVMRGCTICISSPSTVAYEFLLGRGELYLLQTAENQKNIYDYLIKEGLAFDFRNFQQIEQASIDQSLVVQARAFDGKTKQRFLRIMEGLLTEEHLTIRRAKETDTKLLFEWANDAGVRSNSFSKTKIQWDSHQLWFSEKLNSNNSRIFIILKDNLPIGQVRFDIKNEKAFIDYSVQKAYRGAGLGIKLLKKALLEFRKEFKGTIIGEVLSKNIGSWSTFEHLRFQRLSSNKLETLVYEFQ